MTEPPSFLKRRWAWVLLVGSALFALSYASTSDPSWSPLEQKMVEVTAPFLRWVRKTTGGVSGVWREYVALVHVEKENRQLREALDRLNRETDTCREKALAYERMRDLLAFKEVLGRSTVAAQVVGWDPTGWFQSIVIDKGSLSGIDIDMPVVNARGLVGRTVSVSQDHAKVLLVVDQNSAVDSLIQRSRSRGIVKGVSPTACRVEYVAQSSDVRPGDVVITSGLGGVFPKGLAVGEITRVEQASDDFFQDVEMRPFVDFSKLEEVLVIVERETVSDPLPENE